MCTGLLNVDDHVHAHVACYERFLLHHPHQRTSHINATRFQVPTEKFDRVCARLGDHAAPRRRVVSALPADVQAQFVEMFHSRRAQLNECCETVSKPHGGAVAGSYIYPPI